MPEPRVGLVCLSLPAFFGRELAPRGKICPGDVADRVAQPGGDVAPCSCRRLLYLLPQRWLKPQGTAAGWPDRVATVDVPPLPVREAPLQDVAEHRRPAAAEGGDEARDLRLRRLSRCTSRRAVYRC